VILVVVLFILLFLLMLHVQVEENVAAALEATSRGLDKKLLHEVEAT